MFSTLLAVVALFAEFDVGRSIGAALIGGGLFGTIAAGRWVMRGGPEGGASGDTVAASGQGVRYAKLAAVMAVGLGIIFAGVALWSR